MKSNKRGEATIGVLIMTAIAIIVGVILLVGSAQNIGESTNTITVANASLGVASNSTTVYLTSYKLISDVVIYNGTAIVPATNYTVTNNVVYNGALAVSVLPSSGAIYNYTGYQWNISGTAQPIGYIPESGGRAVAGMIIVFFALSIAVVALTPSLRNGVMDLVKG